MAMGPSLAPCKTIDSPSDARPLRQPFPMFATAFGTTGSYYDLSGDGRVAFEDFLLFARSLGKQVA